MIDYLLRHLEPSQVDSREIVAVVVLVTARHMHDQISCKQLCVEWKEILSKLNFVENPSSIRIRHQVLKIVNC